MTRYPLERVGSLLLTKAAVSGPAGVKVIRLLIDTGSVYTVLPVEVLESIGCS
jgi:predicted aspartyl protease